MDTVRSSPHPAHSTGWFAPARGRGTQQGVQGRRVETLNDDVDAEIAALPAALQARLIRLMEMVEHIGLERMREPHAKHIEGQTVGAARKSVRWDCKRPLRHRRRTASDRAARARRRAADHIEPIGHA